MRYQGGKARRLGPKIADSLLHLWDDISDKTGQQLGVYLEPFVGMGGVMRYVVQKDQNARFDRLMGNDLNTDVIVFWKATQGGWRPPSTISQNEWRRLKAQRLPSALRTFAGYGASYGGQFFGGYSKPIPGREFISESKRGVEKVAPLMEEVHFSNKDYRDLRPENAFIYADIPYKNTTGYNTYCRSAAHSGPSKEGMCGKAGFDHHLFWDTMRDWTGRGNLVVVSELTAPDEWVVWEKFAPIKRSLNRQKKGQKSKTVAVEKLFIHRSVADFLRQRRRERPQNRRKPIRI